MKQFLSIIMISGLALSTAACSEIWDEVFYGGCETDDKECIEHCYAKKCGNNLAKSSEKEGVACRSENWEFCVYSSNTKCKSSDIGCVDACYQELCGLKNNNPSWELCVEVNEDHCIREDIDIDIDWSDIDWGSGGRWDDDD